MSAVKTYFVPSDIEEIVQNLGAAADEFAGKTVLISGGCGFLGRYFVEMFSLLNERKLKTPCKILILDNFITANKATWEKFNRPHCQLIQHDVIQPFQTEEKIDYILHAAGIASPFYYREYPLETLDVAVLGTRHMLNLAQKNQAKILFFSSSEIYGDPDPAHVPTAESYRGNVSCLGPRACYDESKRLGETLCRIYHERHGVHSIVVRPFNVYGPGMWKTDYRVLPNFADRIISKSPVSVYGSGNQTRTFCYITDAMTGFTLALLKGVRGEPYNVGNPSPEISMLDLVKYIESVLERKVQYNVIEHPDTYPADEPNRRCPDLRKSQLQLGYAPKVELKDGLRRFFQWAEKNYV